MVAEGHRPVERVGAEDRTQVPIQAVPGAAAEDPIPVVAQVVDLKAVRVQAEADSTAAGAV